MGEKWKHILLFFIWDGAPTHDLPLARAQERLCHFCLVSYTQEETMVKRLSFSNPRIPLQNYQNARPNELQLALALVNNLCSSFFFLTAHALKYLYFNSFRACLDLFLSSGMGRESGWRVLVRINYSFWQASVSLTHLGTRILPCKTVQPFHYYLITRPK